MLGKTDKHFLFEVQLNWLKPKKGILFARDAEGTLPIATPPKFGGAGKPWTPEHYFLSSISGCFMTTFLDFAQKAGLQISHFDCNIIGQIENAEGKYKFTKIDLFPRVYIEIEWLREKAKLVLEKTHKYCLITHSVNAGVFYHSQVLINPDLAIPAGNRKEVECNY